jgi:hypothetical protein
MKENMNLVSASAAIVRRNKRYIVWFYLLNLAFAHFGASAFSDAAHSILDNSLYADKLLHGFNLGVLTEMLMRPEFGAVRGGVFSGECGVHARGVAGLCLGPSASTG